MERRELTYMLYERSRPKSLGNLMSGNKNLSAFDNLRLSNKPPQKLSNKFSSEFLLSNFS